MMDYQPTVIFQYTDVTVYLTLVVEYLCWSR